jgi:O-antigen ligase
LARQDAGSAFYSVHVPAPTLPLIIGLILIFVLGAVGTWPGLTNVSMTVPSLALLAVLVATWLIVREKRKSRWYATPLDLALPIWGLAFIISTVANLSMLAYTLTGLWFAGLYVLIWYITFDVLANKLIDISHLLDGVLIAGAVVLASALLQWASSPWITRVSGLMRNPNILGTFLVILIPLITYRLLTTKGVKRAGYFFYITAAIAVLILSQSRGAVLGVCCSFSLALFYRMPRRRALFAILGSGLLFGFILLGLRGDTGRLSIYKQAIDVIESRMLTGQGLFTFRTHEFQRGAILRVPPDGQNLHAHNIAIQIAVELGLVGVLALAITMVQFIRQKSRSGLQLWCLIAAFGLLGQQMVDFTVMTPSIALCTIIVMSMASLPDPSYVSHSRRPIQLLAVLAIALVTVGLAARYVPRMLL